MALVTSPFHLAIAILLEAVLMGVTFAKGGLMYSLSFRVWAVVFLPIWLASFTDGPAQASIGKMYGIKRV